MSKSLIEIELEETRRDLDLILKQYVAVSEQLRETIQQDMKLPLEARRENLNREARKLEGKIADLETRLRPPRPPAEGKGEGDLIEALPVEGPTNRWAVLVGIDLYADKFNYGSLHVCAADVKAIGEKLIESGYDAQHRRILTDQTNDKPTRNEIWVALESISQRTGPNDLLLFYFSGHGDVENGKSYLIAQDSYRASLEKTAVAMSDVKEAMRNAAANKKVIILDACHSGADIGGKGPKAMSEEFIRQVYEEAEGWAVLASCKQGQLSYEWREQARSVFTHFLLEALSGDADFHEKKIVSVQDAHSYVLDRVKTWAAEKKLAQTPTLAAEVAGDIILVDLRK